MRVAKEGHPHGYQLPGMANATCRRKLRILSCEVLSTAITRQDLPSSSTGRQKLNGVLAVLRTARIGVGLSVGSRCHSSRADLPLSNLTPEMVSAWASDARSSISFARVRKVRRVPLKRM